ncbi:MAG TPA: DUF2600 family protein [Solirubrobacterales bacterium]|jgi:tetraprenyl-beta-curcumene synthase|nr:DUF2600 family protein [Solirubrobacterales bacterium]
MGKTASNPLPLSKRQITVLAAAAGRELSWALPELGKEAKRWSQLAERIPDGPLREDALRSLNEKRGNIAGAMVFSIIPGHRSQDLLRALFLHQVAADFLDNAHERHPTAANGMTLHQAVLDALTPGPQPLANYYADHPWQDDGGYLPALVEACRRSCEALPSFAAVQPLLTLEAERARTSLSFGHLPDPGERDPALRRLAESEYPDQKGWLWFELTAAMCGQLGLFVLLALAAKPDLDRAELDETYAAYWPCIPLLATMLDSFVDQAEDIDNGNHQYVSHYSEPDYAAQRLAEVIETAANALVRLPDGQRHAVILGCMVAFYLSKDSARTPAMEPVTKQLLRAGGSLPLALAPVLRLWRTAYAQRAA